MRRSACFITLFSVCSLQRVKSLIIYPDIPLDYKLQHNPRQDRIFLGASDSMIRVFAPPISSDLGFLGPPEY